MILKIINKLNTLFLVIILGVCSNPLYAEGVEPEADTLLKNMTTYLASLNKLTVTSHSTIESMLDSGQKVMFDHDNLTSIIRPNKLFTQRKGDMVDQRFYYNGKTFTSYNVTTKKSQVIDAPETLATALDFALTQFKITAPGVDLLYRDSYQRLSQNLLSGFYVDTALIDGVECHHLAFRNAEVDWQIWITTGKKPLPKRYVVTSRWITGSPQFVLNMNWNTQPDLSDSLFNFIPTKK
jgi:hypothetical protein